MNRRSTHLVARLRGNLSLVLATGLLVMPLSGTPVAARTAPPPSQVSDDDEGPATTSHEVVEQVAPNASKALNAALARLARDPRDVSALSDAGHAALALGDTQAAIGFLTRADQIAPPTGHDSGTIKADMGVAEIRASDPIDALRWFADAERAGADKASIALDRGLAFDLVGDNTNAQAQYRMVLAHGANDEATRRLALSLAIAGDRRAADVVLAPLLQRQDHAAWRARTFILAMTGKSEEAVALANATMPPDLAGAVAPYLRYMARLTPSQQAAAATLGRFPRAADIGRDDPRVVAYTAAHPRPFLPAQTGPAATAPALAATASQGEQKTDRSRRRARSETRVAASAPAVATVSIPVVQPTAPVPSPVQPGTDQPIAAQPTPTQPQVPRSPGSPQPTTVAPTAPGVVAVEIPPSSAASSAPAMPAAQPSLQTPPQASPVPPPRVLSRLDQPPRTTSVPAPEHVAKPAVHGAKPIVVASDEGEAPARYPGKGSIKADGAKPAHGHGKAEHAADEDQDQPAKGRGAKGKDKDQDKSRDRDKAKDVEARDKSKHDRDTEEAPCVPAKAKTGKGAKAHAAERKARHDKKRASEEEAETCPREDEDKEKADSGHTKGEKADKTDKTDRSEKSAKADKAEKGTSGKGAPKHASRIWVQVLTGGERDKMPAEWRNLAREAHSLKGHKPFITQWHANFRLLTGPFDSDADAQDFIATLRKEGVSAFEWTSPAGQVVDGLPLK